MPLYMAHRSWCNDHMLRICAQDMTQLVFSIFSTVIAMTGFFKITFTFVEPLLLRCCPGEHVRQSEVMKHRQSDVMKRISARMSTENSTHVEMAGKGQSAAERSPHAAGNTKI